LDKPSHQRQQLLTPEAIEVRVWAAVVLVVTIILAGIVFFMLYSVTFVTQPIKSMAPIDQGYLKMLNDIVLLIVGGIGGVMSRKGVQAISNTLGTSPSPTPPAPPVVAPSPAPAPSAGFAWSPPAGSPMPTWVNPALDEDWRPPPPPSTPPDYIDPSKEEIAHERALAKAEA